MDMTFITLHELSRAIRIKFASQAVEDILGFEPEETIGTSLWDYLHPDEVPVAEDIYEQNLRRDKAASLNYFHLRHKRGHWVRCESTWTVASNMLVATTTVYRSGPKSEMRAADCPVVRKLFASPKYPEHHMLSAISRTFSHIQSPPLHEPRATIILNRFTRLSTILYATANTASILGVCPEQLVSNSFYDCIEERYLYPAVHCLESVKANDSVAYLRFWFRSPLQHDDYDSDALSGDEAPLYDGYSDTEDYNDTGSLDSPVSSGPNTPTFPPSSLNSCVEIEAMVSCSSDGLVLVLRRAMSPTPAWMKSSSHPIYVKQSQAPPYWTECEAFQYDTNPFNSTKSLGGGPDEMTLMGSIREAARVSTVGRMCAYSGADFQNCHEWRATCI